MQRLLSCWKQRLAFALGPALGIGPPLRSALGFSLALALAIALGLALAFALPLIALALDVSGLALAFAQYFPLFGCAGPGCATPEPTMQLARNHFLPMNSFF